jgi:hypothetical protein
MANIPSGNMMPGTGGTALPFAGTPSAGTSEIQTLTIGGTPAVADTFKLTFDGYTTAAITWSGTNGTLASNIDAALEALPNIGTGGMTTAVGTMTAGVGTITLTFAGNNAAKAVPTITVSNVVTTGSMTVAVAETTPGVTATFRGLGKGQLVNDTTNGLAYQNTGTATAPTWTKIGTQS